MTSVHTGPWPELRLFFQGYVILMLKAFTKRIAERSLEDLNVDTSLGDVDLVGIVEVTMGEEQDPPLGADDRH